MKAVGNYAEGGTMLCQVQIHVVHAFQSAHVVPACQSAGRQRTAVLLDQYLQVAGHILTCQALNIHQVQDSLWDSLCKQQDVSALVLACHDAAP